ncbi:MAG: hypothetical protein AAF799_13640 [Myxococcota bacterium]
MRLAYLLAGLGLVTASGCFEDTAPVTSTSGNETNETLTTGACDQGSLDCACFPNGTCSPGLVCSQGVCEPFEPGTTSTTTATTSPTTSMADSTSSGGDELSTTSGDESSSGTTAGEESSSSGTSGPAHILFTTSMDWSAMEIGSLAGADALCEGLGVGVRNVPWVAVLADAGTPLSARIDVLGEVVNTVGETLALDQAELLSGTLQALPGYDESGMLVPVQDLAWTGSMSDDCDGWTSDEVSVLGTVGLPTSNDLWLDTSVPLPCSAAPRLYCISQ